METPSAIKTEIGKFARTLDKKISEGIDKLETLDVSEEAYRITLDNIAKSLDIIIKLGMAVHTTKPNKDQTKPQGE